MKRKPDMQVAVSRLVFLAVLTLMFLVLAPGCEKKASDQNNDDNKEQAQEESEEGEQSSSEEGVGEGETDESVEPEAAGADVIEAEPLPDETAAALEALGYVESAPTDNPDERGVTSQNTTAYEGVNLYSSRRRASAILTDMKGEEVHRWDEVGDVESGSWMHVEPYPNGDLLIINKNRSISKRAWDSTLIWRTEANAHHDVAIHEDGRVFVLDRDRDTWNWNGQALPVLADKITVLSKDGEPLEEIELVPLMADQITNSRFRKIRDESKSKSKREIARAERSGDILHTNSIEFLHKEIPGVAPEGSILLSFREANRIAILSPDGSARLWVWGEGELDGQHDATQLPNGNILLFDNRHHEGKDSRVLEVEPVSGEIVWRSEVDMWTRLRGGAQLLPNGNILITESDKGHVLEITRDNEIVWEFWNPDVRGSGDDAERGAIYRLNRFPRSFFEPLVESGRQEMDAGEGR